MEEIKQEKTTKLSPILYFDVDVVNRENMFYSLVFDDTVRIAKDIRKWIKI